MDIKIAAKLSLETALDIPTWQLTPEELSRGHIVKMLERIISGDISGEKAHRWLGWAQAAIVRTGFCDLEAMKLINFLA